LSDKAFEDAEMSSVHEASMLVRNVAEPRPIGDSVKSAISRAARRLGFSYGRTRRIWYRDARRIDAAEMDKLRERAARAEVEQAINSLLVLRARLAATDADFNRPTIVQIECALRGMGFTVGAVADRED
jgi:hypothetical protein